MNGLKYYKIHSTIGLTPLAKEIIKQSKNNKDIITNIYDNKIAKVSNDNKLRRSLEIEKLNKIQKEDIRCYATLYYNKYIIPRTQSEPINIETSKDQVIKYLQKFLEKKYKLVHIFRNFKDIDEALQPYIAEEFLTVFNEFKILIQLFPNTVDDTHSLPKVKKTVIDEEHRAYAEIMHLRNAFIHIINNYDYSLDLYDTETKRTIKASSYSAIQDATNKLFLDKYNPINFSEYANILDLPHYAFKELTDAYNKIHPVNL